MRAIRLHQFGPAENLVLDQLDDLTPAQGKVRIAVEVCGDGVDTAWVGRRVVAHLGLVPGG